MLIANGTIEIKRLTGGGIDPNTGYHIQPSYTWSNPILCQYYANNYNALGLVADEHFTIASFTVLIEEQELEAEQIKLKDNQGSEIGEFSIISIEHLNAVSEIKILI